MKEYLKAQNKINESVIENVFSSDELHRFSISDSRWPKTERKNCVKNLSKKGKYTNLNLEKIISQKCLMSTGDS